MWEVTFMVFEISCLLSYMISVHTMLDLSFGKTQYPVMKKNENKDISKMMLANRVVFDLELSYDDSCNKKGSLVTLV